MWPGKPYPLGSTWDEKGTNFSIFSENAKEVKLLLYETVEAKEPKETIVLDERTGHMWHTYLPDSEPGQLYAYSIDGPYEPQKGHRFNSHKALIDPYAKAISGGVTWDDAVFGYKVGDPATDISFDDRDSGPFVPKGVTIDTTFDWGGDRHLLTPWNETITYELHVKGFTKLNPDVDEQVRGTYSGLSSPKVIQYLEGPRGDRRRAAPSPPARRRQVPSRQGAHQLLGLQHHRVLRTALRLLEQRDRWAVR